MPAIGEQPPRGQDKSGLLYGSPKRSGIPIAMVGRLKIARNRNSALAANQRILYQVIDLRKKWRYDHKSESQRIADVYRKRTL